MEIVHVGAEAREEPRFLRFLARPTVEVSATWPRDGRTASNWDPFVSEGLAALTVGAVTGSRDTVRLYEPEGFVQEAVPPRDTRLQPG